AHPRPERRRHAPGFHRADLVDQCAAGVRWRPGGHHVAAPVARRPRARQPADPRDDSRMVARARGVDHGRAVGGRRHRRLDDGDQDGAERVRGVSPAREPAVGGRAALAALHYHCQLRALRFRELRLHRDPDRRDRRHCALPAWRPGADRAARHDRGLDRRIHDRDHCGDHRMSVNGGLPDISETLDFLRSRVTRRPRVMLILGSGLGGLADEIEEPVRIPYAEIPGFPAATVVGHSGTLVAGTLEGAECVAMQGRFHLYEGHDPSVVAFPIRVMAALGARTLIVTNAAGGLRRTFRPGDLMIIDDHINLTGRNPLIGPVAPGETRFPDMSEAYDRELRAIAERVATGLGVRVVRGVYCALSGPSYETPAEIRM